MLAEIISIGTELILGDVVDTNSVFLAEKLTASGFDIHYIQTVGDNFPRLVTTLKQALQRADLIITTGGLGPTEDDLTREALAEATGLELVFYPELLQKIENYFAHLNKEMSVNNRKQATLPKGAKALANPAGTAPGILLQQKGKTIISLPGVPREMKKMFLLQVEPLLQKWSQDIIQSKVLNFWGISESSLEMQIKDILTEQKNPSLALLAGKGEVKLRITVKGKSREENNHLIQKVEDRIKARVGKYIYASNDQDLAELVGSLLKKRGLTLAVAESCTGGLLGSRITAIPGSSSYFLGGIISYSNQLKAQQLGVRQDTLSKFGAVSAETAQEMVQGIIKLTNADLGLSITGIAGPGGGSKEKPVGLVYLALAHKQKTKVYPLKLKGERQWIRWLSTQYALNYLRNYLQNLN